VLFAHIETNDFFCSFNYLVFCLLYKENVHVALLFSQSDSLNAGNPTLGLLSVLVAILLSFVLKSIDSVVVNKIMDSALVYRLQAKKFEDIKVAACLFIRVKDVTGDDEQVFLIIQEHALDALLRGFGELSDQVSVQAED
jgi:hypothetical protein